MTIYGFGFVLAAILSLFYAYTNEKKITTLSVILSIICAMFSWIGVIIMIILLQMKKD